MFKNALKEGMADRPLHKNLPNHLVGSVYVLTDNTDSQYIICIYDGKASQVDATIKIWFGPEGHNSQGEQQAKKMVAFITQNSIVPID